MAVVGGIMQRNVSFLVLARLAAHLYTDTSAVTTFLQPQYAAEVDQRDQLFELP